ncbi:hypothetical protein ACTHOQ_12805 [Solibacillus silvestris]|uniref:hypothetical protein n=1 Tax=Solibacillus silvestris TaxID=76853 RepID=UPI003F7CE498
MLKSLLQERVARFHTNVKELANGEDVFGIQATSLTVSDRNVAVGYVVDKKIFLKGVHPGETMIKLTDGDKEAFIKLTVHNTGAIVAEITPYIGNKNVVPVYFKKILGETAVAVDLKGALANYLISEGKIDADSLIEEVHYESMHPNVIDHSIDGRFILGYHINGLPLTNKQEYALANRIVTLKFSKINYRYNGSKKTLNEKIAITFKITDGVL